MRSRSLGSFIFLSLMVLGQARTPFRSSDEALSSRSNSADVPSSSLMDFPSSTSPDILSKIRYTCLYASPDLPLCNFNGKEDNNYDTAKKKGDYWKLHDTTDVFDKERTSPTKKSFADKLNFVTREYPKGEVTVYKIEGCLPSRLPFRMSRCRHEDIADKIVDVRKLYPFEGKGPSEAPFEFPDFDLDQWTLMTRRLRTDSDSAETIHYKSDSKKVRSKSVSRSKQRQIELTE